MDPTTKPPRADVAALPMKSLSLFMGETGLSTSTVYRYRKRGWLKCENIAGRFYISGEEMIRFNTRRAEGEFAKAPQKPKRETVGEAGR